VHGPPPLLSGTSKAALVRHFAEGVLQGDLPVNKPSPDTFSRWLASRLRTREELVRFEDVGKRVVHDEV